jgi:hypothetical protein
MAVLPIVSPAHNADGIALMPVITALYPFSLDEGSVTPVNCFLIKKITNLNLNQTLPTPIKVNLKRVQLLSNSLFTGSDYGDSAQAGELYRSLIEITSSSPLSANSEYSVILSKEIGKQSVFDIQASNLNTGSISPLVKGPYNGLIDNTYTLEVIIGGSESTAKYRITRSSDNYSSIDLTAKKRFIEIEEGLFFKFDIGTYVAGDIFTIKVKPLVKTNEIYSWDFKTGDSLYVLPSDQNSGVVVGLPIQENNTPTDPTSAFKLVSISPALNSVMNNSENKVVTFTFNKSINPASITSEKIKTITESTVSSYYGPLDFTYEIQDNKLIINFQ